MNAISCYRESLGVLDSETAPLQYAMVQNNLGLAYADLATEDDTSYMRQAVKCYNEALEAYAGLGAHADWAAVQNNLGNAYSQLEEDRVQNLHAAAGCYNQALTVYQPKKYPFDHAMVQNNLGEVFADLARLGDVGCFERAIRAYEQALAIYRLHDDPANHRMAARNLGALHFRQKDWQKAHESYETAILAGELLYSIAASGASRQSQVAEGGSIFENDAYSLARLGRLDAAVERIESGRTRALAESLSLDRADLRYVGTDDRAAFEKLRDRLRVLEGEARFLGDAGLTVSVSRSFAEVSAQLRSLRRRMNRVLGQIRADLPEFMSTGLDFESIAVAGLPDCPLVYLMTTSQGSVAFVVPWRIETLADNHVMWVDSFTSSDLGRLLFDQGDGRGLLSQALYGSRASLMAKVEQVVTILGRDLMSSVAERLVTLGYRRCMLVPCGRLTLLPLHSARISDSLYLDDVLEVAYIPSANALRNIRLLERVDASRSLLAVVDPPHNVSISLDGIDLQIPLPRLPMAHAESMAIASLFPKARLLEGAKATRLEVLAQLREVSHAHFACHGRFDPSRPTSSGLALAAEDELTLKDILKEPSFSSLWLVTLAACQTSLAEFQHIPDELVGLPAAFLQAGAGAVVGSLWEVPDVATALLLTRFYEHYLKDNLAPAAALIAAQRWLRESTAAELELAQWYERPNGESDDAAAQQKAAYYRANPDEKPFAHPYYWAAFTCTGAGT